MSLMINIRRKPQDEVRTRFGRVQEAARQGADVCRQGASGAAGRIAPMAGERVMVVRGWSAPRLRQAARFVETGIAPRVSMFLSDAAHRVEPPQQAKPGRGALMAMMGVLAAVSVAGAVATRRGVIRDLTKGSGEHVDDATSADSMTVTGADADGQVHSPH
ncbi:hypothetical protein E1293_30015 [Actinomadura darangshiensis]|uniref:Uncharacterized protein n=1 Tax=Actinomadura darangshiensis TaxID=705336 RepID=A0A4R5ASL5_9ACTN|nr:hypothetical protein [Actinomadura darangshiensis]TDD74104.1 hypothetical protein E1293_30015 [Actinomadura darangshiensis]